jgi:transposase
MRGQHPDLAPDQYGATAHRLGPRAMAAAHILYYQVGIPVRKMPLVLNTLTGLVLT